MQTVLDNQRSFCFRMRRIAHMPGRYTDWGRHPGLEIPDSARTPVPRRGGASGRMSG
ncbi:hypothetical protein KL86DES1_20729 [uncultured Desulfovibrio sp.]|uniref:Uncharacterized protein n=1 Tax=uncultured Desulfovibrio sp. TaxID=167968 RepID=A0A212L5I6_9BACT|nr:hypothetical protein KL86DES1_20729 [uncultured Desulfovibrio sp.]VZH33630.1 conserved protein of unknown function [Desulfovibrio sp. 86]